MADNNLPPIPKTALNEQKLRLFGTNPNGGRAPMAQFGMVMNQPRIDIFTNVEGDSNNGIIRAAMDTPTFYSFLELLKRAVEGPADSCDKIINKTGKPPEPFMVSTTVIGKDREGVVFFSVIDKDENRPRLQFKFLPSNYHNLVKRDGSAFSEAEMSEVYAMSFYHLLQNLVANVLDTHFIERKPQQRGGGNRGGYGGGNRGGGGGNYGGNRGGGGGNYGGGSNHQGGGNAGGGGGGDFGDGFPM